MSRQVSAPGTEEVVRARPSTATAGPKTPAVRRAARDRKQDLLGFILVTPLVVLMLLVIGFPLLNTVLLSLRNQGIAGSPSQFVGIETYRNVLGNSDLWKSFGRSAVWLLGNMVVQTLLGFVTALLLSRVGRWSRAARVWVLMPWVIPTVAVAVIWQWLTNSNYGIFAKLLGAIGIDDARFFADSTWAMPTLIVMNSWHWFPLGAVIIFGALQTVPAEIYEAAKVDGASAWSTFWHITLPMLQPVLFALGLVGSLWSFNSWTPSTSSRRVARETPPRPHRCSSMTPRSKPSAPAKQRPPA